MTFISQAAAAVILVGITLVLQSAGMATFIHWVRVWIARGKEALTPWHTGVVMIRLTTAMIVLQLLQILVWAGFYRWKCLPTWESSFYFSAVSYSTVGYGEVILPHGWHTLGPMESIMGVLMSGLSVSALFAVAARLIREHIDPADPDAQPAIRHRHHEGAVKVNEIG